MLHTAFLPVLEISISALITFVCIAFIDYSFVKPLTIELNRRLEMEAQIAQRKFELQSDLDATDPFALYLEEKEAQIAAEIEAEMFADKIIAEETQSYEGSFDEWLTLMFHEWLQDNQVNCFESFDKETQDRLYKHWLATETELSLA
jgi:hypothetical protein